ncbi:MAG: four helix bundle protein [Bacteroidetes bacterium]|nr:four helix bundle protein [Bacteroidota bacterium]NCQ12286.1 four helix bundle protein [Bacteroidota bacterium]
MQEALKNRTKKIGLAVISLVNELPNKPVGWAITNQIIRSSTSIGANYRAACRAKSTADFINKLKIVEEEADETLFWLEILEESGLLTAQRIIELKSEVNQILSIIVASIKTARQKANK